MKPPKVNKLATAKTYGNSEDAKENQQIKRKKIYAAAAEHKDIPPNDGKRPNMTAQADKIVNPRRIGQQVKRGLY